MIDQPLTFPAGYASAPTVLVPINAALIPYLAGALAQYEDESLWLSDADYEAGYNAIVALKAIMTALNNVPANEVIAGPASGPAAPAAPRLLVIDDIPAIPWNWVIDRPFTYPPDHHASTHWVEGADAIAPGDIGAAEAGHLHEIAYSSLTGIPGTFTPATHASTHATAGSDPIAPAAIGAATAAHGHTYSSLSGIPGTFTPAAHASTHAAAGSDPVTPAAIGAATSGHTHALQAWQDMTLVNGWLDFGSGYNTAAYYKDPGGIVHLRGLIKSGTATAGTVLATLPAGYRPPAIELFIVPSFSGGAVTFGRIDINTAGQLLIQSGGNGYIGLDGITFRT